VMKALEKDRARRYGTASELARDIFRHLSHDPVEAAPPSKRYRMSRFVRKHAVTLNGCNLIGLTLVLLLAFVQWAGWAGGGRLIGLVVYPLILLVLLTPFGVLMLTSTVWWISRGRFAQLNLILGAVLLPVFLIPLVLSGISLQRAPPPIDPGRVSLQLHHDSLRRLDAIGLAELGVRPGMRMVAVAGRPIQAYAEFQAAVAASGGVPVRTVWVAFDNMGKTVGEPIRCAVPVLPTFQELRYEMPIPDVDQDLESGLLGLTPLVKIVDVHPGPNQGLLRAGDVILRAGPVDGPRSAQFRAELAQRKGGEIELVVLRAGEEQTLTADVDRRGLLNVGIEAAWDLPLVAEPMSRLRTEPDAQGVSRAYDSPVAGLAIQGRARILAVNDTPVSDWRTLREALCRHTDEAERAGREATVTLTILDPTPGYEPTEVAVSLSASQVVELQDLGWTSELGSRAFEPLP